MSVWFCWITDGEEHLDYHCIVPFWHYDLTKKHNFTDNLVLAYFFGHPVEKKKVMLLCVMHSLLGNRV